MESQKIINLLGHKDEDDPKFQTKKWYIINDRNNEEYGGIEDEKEYQSKLTQKL